MLRHLPGAFALAALLQNAPTLAAGVTVHDARGQDIAIDNPARIVAIGGAITEVLYALGYQDRIVGVDTTSVYPSDAMKTKPNVGYMRQLSAEGVVGLNPTLVLAIEGSGPKPVMDLLESTKTPIVLVPEGLSGDGIVEKIKLIGHAMGADARADCLADAVSRDLDSLKALRARVTRPVRVMFVMSFLNGRAMVAGRSTAAQEIIALAGGINAVDGYEGYKPITDEAIVAAKADVVLSIQRSKDQLEADAVYAHPAFALTPVAANKSFISMEGLYLLGFGPRTASAARDLAIRLYPDLAAQPVAINAVAAATCRQ